MTDDSYQPTNRERAGEAKRRRQRVHGRGLVTVIDALERDRAARQVSSHQRPYSAPRGRS